MIALFVFLLVLSTHPAFPRRLSFSFENAQHVVVITRQVCCLSLLSNCSFSKEFYMTFNGDTVNWFNTVYHIRYMWFKFTYLIQTKNSLRNFNFCNLIMIKWNSLTHFREELINWQQQSDSKNTMKIIWVLRNAQVYNICKARNWFSTQLFRIPWAKIDWNC